MLTIVWGVDMGGDKWVRLQTERPLRTQLHRLGEKDGNWDDAGSWGNDEKQSNPRFISKAEAKGFADGVSKCEVLAKEKTWESLYILIRNNRCYWDREDLERSSFGKKNQKLYVVLITVERTMWYPSGDTGETHTLEFKGKDRATHLDMDDEIKSPLKGAGEEVQGLNLGVSQQLQIRKKRGVQQRRTRRNG